MVEWSVARHRPSTRAGRGSDLAPGPPHRVPPRYRVPLGAPQPSRCHAPACWAAAGTNRHIDTFSRRNESARVRHESRSRYTSRMRI